MKRLLLATALVLALAPVPAMAAEPGTFELGEDVGAYRRFLIYPHLQRGFTAMEKGEARPAIAAFEHARSLAPRNPETALYLANAYRRFERTEQARWVLQRQLRHTPDDPRLRQALTALQVPKPEQKACADPAALACQAEQGSDYVRAGALDRAEALLNGDRRFAASAAGVALRREIAQRAIHQGEGARAERQFAALQGAGAIGTREREQWLNLLLARGATDAAAGLMADGLDSSRHQLAYAETLAARGDGGALAAYLGARHPRFESAGDEARWLRLLQRVSSPHPDLLIGYRPRHPGNRGLQARLALPLVMAHGDTTAARRLLDTLPLSEFGEARFELALREGRLDTAAAQAEALFLQSPQDLRRLDALSYRLVEAGAGDQALRLLMAGYPFAANGGEALTLYQRLAMLIAERPARLSPQDRERLRRPLPSIAQRSAQAMALAAIPDCDGLRQLLADLASEYPAPVWRSLGHCHRESRPGLAEFAYAQAWESQADDDSARALAYQAHAAGDYATALQAWQSLPPERLSQEQLLAAATTAVAAGRRDAAQRWLDAYAARAVADDDGYWWLRAQTNEADDPRRARAEVERAIALREDPRYYARLAQWQQADGDSAQALASLQHALRLAPDDAQLHAALAYAYLHNDQPAPARANLERVRAASPDDPRVAEDLVYVGLRLDDPERLRGDVRQAVDLLDGAGGDEPERSFRLRRLHEQLGRRWQFTADATFGDSVAAAANASAPGAAYRSYAQFEAQYRLGHLLGRSDGDALSVYGRVFAGSGAEGRLWPTEAPMLGVGVRWKPLRQHVFYLALEQQVPLDDSPDTRSDVMLRVSASPLRDPRHDDDWHVQGKGWVSHSIYLDAAHYLRAERSVFTVDYQLGLHRKLAGASTLEPYLRLQYTGLDRAGGFDSDARAGIGIRWNRWYGETRYDAYRRRFSIGLEWQHPFHTYLDEKDALFLSAGNRW